MRCEIGAKKSASKGVVKERVGWLEKGGLGLILLMLPEVSLKPNLVPEERGFCFLKW